MLLAAGLYHWVFLKGAREGWPVVGTLVKLVVKDEFEQRDRFMRENLDAMARKLGEMQAKLVQLEALGERVSGLAGLNPAEITDRARTGRSAGVGPLARRWRNSRPRWPTWIELTANSTDLMTVVESRLIDQRIGKMMLPTQQPVAGRPSGSSFGWRIDPFTGRSALHTGLDFQAEPGTPILAAAGGVVVAQEVHPAYGNMVEVDHGNDLITRYAHASRSLGEKGRPGQARPEDRRGRHAPAAPPGRTCISR